MSDTAIAFALLEASSMVPVAIVNTIWLVWIKLTNQVHVAVKVVCGGFGCAAELKADEWQGKVLMQVLGAKQGGLM